MAATLKELEGTEKQIAWAEKIRTRIIAEAQREMDNPAWQIMPVLKEYRAVADEAFARLCRQANAGWWIDHQHDMGYQLMNYFILKTRDKWIAEGSTMFRNPNQFISGNRQKMLVGSISVY